MSKFKVGDRVMAVDKLGLHRTPAPGTITKLYRPVPIEGVYDYQVAYDDHPGGPLWSNVTGLIPEKRPVIVITTDGRTTTATKRIGRQVIATAKAFCNPDDTFFFDTGAALAFARLVGAEVKFADAPETTKPKKPFRAVCTDILGDVGKSHFRVGAIYDAFTIGSSDRVKDDHGTPFKGERVSKTDIRVDLGFGAVYFIPLVED